ncbi:hypothetical protein [Mucilaginibacter sp. SP1R1]|uniref:hypothetical protein n=1 Tax=Mucilaginibacter sp. SP1R1 TaxID=2723091 RepID=UPI0016175BAD|nr:hypothetical protein [Mucilaginibacter sp. SP1R1]MBB6149774.1 hypothetical protein [Mucilaginibacter sp. SP1R1]
MLYLHVTSSDIHIYLKTRLKSQLLLLTVVLSFLAFGGYTGNNQPTKQINYIELHTITPLISKGGISYKRVVSALYNLKPASFTIRVALTQAALIYTRLTINCYQQLNQLFRVTKHAMLYAVNHQYYMANDDAHVVSFQIG